MEHDAKTSFFCYYVLMKSRYIPITQQKYCCVPACIQMIMYKNLIPLMSQEKIGYALGLTVPEDEAYLFENPRLGEMPVAGWGTQIYKEEFTLDTAFKSLSIPFGVSMRLIDDFSSLDEIIDYLVQNEHSDSDVLVCYNYGVLFDTQSNSGHVNVFDSIDSKKRTVTLVDPEQQVPKCRTVSIDKLYEALVVHGSEKSGGFWRIVCNQG